MLESLSGSKYEAKRRGSFIGRAKSWGLKIFNCILKMIFSFKWSISSTFYAHVFCTKVQSKNVTREKLREAVFYKKCTRKMLMKLTPSRSRAGVVTCHLSLLTHWERDVRKILTSLPNNLLNAKLTKKVDRTWFLI